MSSLRKPRRTAVRRLGMLSIIGSFVLRAAPVAAASVGGHVVDPDGLPVKGARVLISNPIGGIAEEATAVDGGFRLAAVPPGRVELRVIADGLEANPITLTLGSDDVRDLIVRLRVSAVVESVVVSAANVDLPLSRAGDSVTVITRSDLEARQIETVADALRVVPGLAVTRSGGRGAITSLFPRGGGSNYTLVLVDGVRANAFGGGFDFGHLSTADIDRIEIVRNPESALFGSDAIGAVVQIVTRRGGPPRFDALVEGGTNATARATVDAAGSRGRWSWGAGAEHSRSDGYTGTAPASGETVSNDDDHFDHASGSVGYERPGGVDFLATANVGRDERGFPGPFGTNPIGAFGGVDRVSRGVNDTRQIGGRLGHPWSSRARQRIDASFTDLGGTFVSKFGTSESGTKRFTARVQEDIVVSQSAGASLGTEYLDERGSSTFITGAADQPIAIGRRVLGAFGEGRYVMRERLFVTGGVRIERLSRAAVEPNFSPFSSRPAFPEQIVASVNPKVAASFVVGGTRLHASAGTGIRPPDAFEIAFTDNPNLKPERSRSIDAGVEQRFGADRLAVGATAFFNSYDDLIITVGRSLHDASRYRSDNISNARARGVELTADLRPVRALTIRAGYTFVATEILSVDGLNRVAPDPFTVGDPLLRRPRHLGSIDAMYSAGRVATFAEVTSRSRVLDVEPTYGSFGGLFFSPGYVVVNAGATIHLTSRLDVFGRVLNLTDRAYEETLGYPALGRTAMIGVRVAASR